MGYVLEGLGLNWIGLCSRRILVRIELEENETHAHRTEGIWRASKCMMAGGNGAARSVSLSVS